MLMCGSCVEVCEGASDMAERLVWPLYSLRLLDKAIACYNERFTLMRGDRATRRRGGD